MALTGRTKMNYKQTIRCGFVAVLTCCVTLVAGAVLTVSAQETNEPKAVVGEKSSRRDPFRKYQPVMKSKASVTVLVPPSIQERIDRYRAMKMAAANAHVPAPKPTTALLLSETQVIGIFHTPRGWAAMVEATPIKLSYVIYPGEMFFDGQLVAIEENRLIFRRDTVWTDGRRDKSVEAKALRQASPTEAMTATKVAPASAPATASEKPAVPEP
jgi:hypothetical protein